MNAAEVKKTEKPVSGFAEVFARLRARRFAMTSLWVCLAFLAIAVFSEAYTAYCKKTGAIPVYERENHAERLEAPSMRHLLGSDYLGRDVLTRAFFATKTAVKVGVAASLISAAAGVILGILAGYYGGFVDDLVMWIYSTFASMPTLLFILAFTLLVSKGFLYPPLASAFSTAASMFGTEPGMLAVYIAIGLTGWVALCRVVRGETMRIREAQYVQAARVLGQTDFRIVTRHILPNLAHLVIVYFTMRFAYAVMTEVIVSYLGLGVQFEPSWGVMIADGQERLWRGMWWEIGAAAGFMFLLALALNVLGDALRDALDPRLRF